MKKQSLIALTGGVTVEYSTFLLRLSHVTTAPGIKGGGCGKMQGSLKKLYY